MRADLSLVRMFLQNRAVLSEFRGRLVSETVYGYAESTTSLFKRIGGKEMSFANFGDISGSSSLLNQRHNFGL